MSLSLDKNDIKQKVNKASTKEDLETFRLQFLGKKGFLTQEMKFLSSLSIEEKKSKGKKLNQIKIFIEKEIANKKIILEQNEIDQKLKKEIVDVSLPSRNYKSGKIHPISQSIDKIIHIFGLIFQWI